MTRSSPEPGSGHSELIWDAARALVDDPEAVEAMAQAHALGPSGRCPACRPQVWWPCLPWLVATLARIPRPNGSPDTVV